MTLLRINRDSVTTHSVRSDFTGFAMAAFNAFKPTVKNATNNANAPAITNIHQYIFVRYAKSLSQLFIIHQETGIAIKDAISTNLMKSFESIDTIPETEAPNTFLIPISLMRCSAA